MTCLQFRLALAIGLSSLALATPRAIAQTRPQPDTQPIVPANPEPATESASPATQEANEADTDLLVPAPLAPTDAIDPASTKTYSDESMSFTYPSAWQVTREADGSVAIVSQTDTTDTLVETKIFRMAADPGAVVNANLDSFREEGAAVNRYRTVPVDGQDALVLWLSERPNELENAIATFIGYANNTETIFLFSRYSASNLEAEGKILYLHSSFANLAAIAEADIDPSASKQIEAAHTVVSSAPSEPTESATSVFSD